MQFIWRPYVCFEEELAKIVDEHEMEVFSSQIVVVCYWIVERYNSSHVMTQFGLQQIVSPPFYNAINREDRVLKATVDYSKKVKERIKEWNGRKKSVLEGEVEVDSNHHSEEYFQWYRGISRLRIGRFEVVEGATNPDLDQQHQGTQQDPGPSQSHPQIDLFDSTMMEIGDFASHLLEGVEAMKKQPEKEKMIDQFLDRIGRRIMRFESACVSRFAEFKLQDYISSSSDEEERKRPKTLDDSINQVTPSNVPLQMPPHSIPPTPIGFDSISNQPV